jgi:hypothetical protein
MGGFAVKDGNAVADGSGLNGGTANSTGPLRFEFDEFMGAEIEHYLIIVDG